MKKEWLDNGDGVKGKVTMPNDEISRLVAAFRDLPGPHSERNQDQPLLTSVWDGEAVVAQNVGCFTTWNTIV